MILAVGLYELFIGAVASVTRLKLDAGTIRFLVFLAVGLGVAVVGLSAPAVWLQWVPTQRWAQHAWRIRRRRLNAAPGTRARQRL